MIMKDIDYYIEELLQVLTFKLQMPKNKHENAGEKLESLYNFIDSKIEGEITTFPQGSFKMKTTVKPLQNQEYDIDCISILPSNFVNKYTKEDLIDVLYKIFKESERYKDKVEKKKRSLRVIYADDFHVDILPAKYLNDNDPYELLVPDKHVEDYVLTNPKGYCEWFDKIADNYESADIFKSIREFRSELEELEEDDSFKEKPPLKRAVQLVKRARDIYFEKYGVEDFSPSSILLSTLYAKYYKEEYRIFSSIRETTQRILENVNSLDGTNPVLSSEDFKEKWSRDNRYEENFIGFIQYFNRKLNEVNESLSKGNINEIEIILSETFGEAIVQEVRNSRRRNYQQVLSRYSNVNTYSLTEAIKRGGIKSKKHTFYGG